MTETGPRKGLWELMGQKRSMEDPPPMPAAPDAVPAAESAATDDASASTPLAAPLDLSETLPDTKPRGRSLWQMMQQAEANAKGSATTGDEGTAAPPIDLKLTKSELNAPVKGADRRLRQLQTPAVVDGGVDEAVNAPYQVAPETMSPGSERADLLGVLAESPESRIVAAAGSQSSRSALWCVVLGGLSAALSLLAIYPALWTRIPSSIAGFSALMLGFLAQQETQRSARRRSGFALACAGMGLGLFGMFAGPAIYTPLDVYGRLCNSYTDSNLRQLGLATAAYTQKQQSFPAGGLFLERKQREPQHGWMTLLLPYLPEGAPVAKQMDLSKPYFDPANKAAVRQQVSAFMAAGASMELIQGKYGPAHFAGLGGVVRLSDGSMAHVGVFGANSSTTAEDVVDGTSNTMLAGEISTKFPAWAEARNWRLIGKGLNRDADGFGNARHSGAMFLMADGSVRYFDNQTDAKVLRALSTRDGEEQTSR